MQGNRRTPCPVGTLCLCVACLRDYGGTVDHGRITAGGNQVVPQCALLKVVEVLGFSPGLELRGGLAIHPIALCGEQSDTGTLGTA